MEKELIMIKMEILYMKENILKDIKKEMVN